MFAFLAAHRRELFPDELFADLFAAGRGRPSVPVEVVASVLVLQTLHGLSDREAVEALTFDLRWKAACGLAVTDAGFHPTT
ncbi:Transposase domain, partial [Pseudonocardia oroxyli]